MPVRLYRRPRLSIGGATAVVPFNPGDISGVVDYGIGSGIISSGGSISSWPGELGVMTLAQSTASRQPLVSAGVSPGGNDVAVFDDVDDFLATDDAGGLWGGPYSQPNILALSLKLTSLTTHQAILDGVNSTQRHYFAMNTTAPDNWTYFAGVTRDPSGTPDTSWHRFIIDYNGASSAFEIDDSQTDTGNVGSQVLGGVNMGISNSNSNPAGCQVAAWVLINSTISGDDRTSLRSWLADQ